jgi:hypothetical protein
LENATRFHYKYEGFLKNYLLEIIKCIFFCLFKIPDNDLRTRRIGQKVDPVTGIVYVKDVYNPEKIVAPV